MVTSKSSFESQVLTHAVFAGFAGSLPLSVMRGWFGRRHALKVLTGLIVLSSVPLALTGSDHRDFVGARASILTLQLYSLGSRLVIDTPPFLGTPPAPVLCSIAPSDPIGEHWKRQALTSTNQLLQRADAGTLAIRDVLGGTQLPTTHLNPSVPIQSSITEMPASISGLIHRAVAAGVCWNRFNHM